MSVGGFVRNVPLSPVVTGSLLLTLTKAPDSLRQPLLQKIGEYLSLSTITRGITALKWLCAVGVARNLHIWLSNIAQNNFRLRSEKHRYDWPNEVAVVTGAASGFGALIAKGLAAKGINVMAVDIRAEAPEDIEANPRIHYYQCDITDRAKVMELADEIRSQYGHPSILINNAGVCHVQGLIDMSEKAVNQTFDVNIISHYWTLQAFLPAMIENKKGHVVALASIASFTSPPGMIAYANSKVAVLSLHEGLQQETRAIYKAPEVKFTSVHPTFANTPLAAPFMHVLEASKSFVLDPQVVADAVVNQILSGTGKQIILGDISWLAGVRAWPHWIAQLIAHSSDDQFKNSVPRKDASSKSD